MARTRRAWKAVLALAACSLVGCLGGQTGQPGPAACAMGTTIGANEETKGVSPAEFAQAFVGQYRAPLHWLKSGGGAEDAASLSSDEITISISYNGADARLGDCSADLFVPAHVTVTTRGGSVSEEGDVDLTGVVGSVASASFSLSAQNFIVAASLSHVPATAELTGTVTPTAANVGADSAEFSSNFSATGADGGTP